MLSELPNIGKELEKRLQSIGIQSKDDLEQMGSLGVLERLEVLNTPGCLNMLYAMEGAIRGIRWHGLDPEVKRQLKTGLKALQERHEMTGPNR